MVQNINTCRDVGTVYGKCEMRQGCLQNRLRGRSFKTHRDRTAGSRQVACAHGHVTMPGHVDLCWRTREPPRPSQIGCPPTFPHLLELFMRWPYFLAYRRLALIILCTCDWPKGMSLLHFLHMCILAVPSSLCSHPLPSSSSHLQLDIPVYLFAYQFLHHCM